MDRLNSNEFWLQASRELGLVLPDLPSEPEQEPASEIVHPEDEQVWNSEYFKPPPFRLRRCQIEGTNYWKQNQNGCLLEHATGSGKTLTGLIIASNMFESSDFVIIACPLKDIALQWEEAAKECFKDDVSISIFDSDHKQNKPMGTANQISRGGFSKALLIYVNNSLTKNEIWSELRMAKITRSFSIILDEAHNWLSDSKLDFLEHTIFPKKNSLLSLTAKLYKSSNHIAKRQHQLLEGSVKPHYFGLFEAIREGSDGNSRRILKEYDYYLNLIPVDISQDVESVKEELLEKSITESVKIISQNKQLPTIVYVKSAESDPIRGAKAVSSKISLVEGVIAMDYIGLSDSQNKKRRRDRFNHGDIDVLVAVRCLDEGVNIPRIQRLMLVHGSLDDERQWIQRRGRALRIDPEFKGNPEIHDFLPVPDSSVIDEPLPESQHLILQHYEKVIALGQLAKRSYNLKEYKKIIDSSR